MKFQCYPYDCHADVGCVSPPPGPTLPLVYSYPANVAMRNCCKLRAVVSDSQAQNLSEWHAASYMSSCYAERYHWYFFFLNATCHTGTWFWKIARKCCVSRCAFLYNINCAKKTFALKGVSRNEFVGPWEKARGQSARRRKVIWAPRESVFKGTDELRNWWKGCLNDKETLGL